MNKIVNIKNMGLLLIAVLFSIIVLNTKEVKATGTVTWSGPSSITIRETINHIAGPITASRGYILLEGTSGSPEMSTMTTINYTTSDTPTNYQITKTAAMSLSSLTFSAPGDYEYSIMDGPLEDSNGNNYLVNYIERPWDDSQYRVTISVRNVTDANNVPTGNFTASLVLEKGEYNEQTDDYDISKVTPSSGVLYADFNYKTRTENDEPSGDYYGHIEVSKTVKGIGADTTKYFPFTVIIRSNATADYPLDSTGWTYPISGVDSTITYNGNTITNPTTITTGTPTIIYLKHGQTAIIGQGTSGGETFDLIPKGYGQCLEPDSGGDEPDDPQPKKYDFSTSPKVKKLDGIGEDTCYGSYFSVQEDSGDYSASYIAYDNPPVEGDYFMLSGVDNLPNTVDFINTKTMSPVTGVILTVLPYLILAGIGVGGTLLVMHLKKEEKKVNSN